MRPFRIHRSARSPLRSARSPVSSLARSGWSRRSVIWSVQTGESTGPGWPGLVGRPIGSSSGHSVILSVHTENRPGAWLTGSGQPGRPVSSSGPVRSVTPVARSGWSGRPVSLSVQTGETTRPRCPGPVARSPGQFVRSGRLGQFGDRAGPLDQIPVARSVPVGPVARSGWSGRLGQFARSPVQVGPVARSVRPFRPVNRTGPVDRVRSARSPGHVQSLQYDTLLLQAAEL